MKGKILCQLSKIIAALIAFIALVICHIIEERACPLGETTGIQIDHAVRIRDVVTK